MTKDNDGYMTKLAVRQFVGGSSNPIANSTLTLWMKTRGFPLPIRITQRCPLWRKSEVVEWLESHSFSKGRD